MQMKAESLSELNTFESRYELLHRIGSGGMGDVYAAYDCILGKHVAIKVIKLAYSRDQQIQQKFYSEARALLMLCEPHIVEAFDFGMTPSGQLYLAMEYVRGISLHELCNAHLPLSVIKDIVCQLLDALEYVHGRGIVHRDIKSENVLVVWTSESLAAKLVDFGLAVVPLEENESGQSRTFGTPGFIAPEQICDGMSRACPASDLYSVGVILYELLCGKLPFDGDSDEAILRAQLNDERQPIAWNATLKNVPKNTKDAFEAVLERALARRMWMRYLNAAEFKSDIEKISVVQRSLPDGPQIEKMRKMAFEADCASNDEGLFSKFKALDAVEIVEAHARSLSDVDLDAIELEESAENSYLPHGSCFCEEHEHVWDALDAMAKSALLGMTRAVVIRSEFGFGKTFLLQQLSKSWRSLNAQIVQVHCTKDDDVDEVSAFHQSAAVLWKILTAVLNEPADSVDGMECSSSIAQRLHELGLQNTELLEIFLDSSPIQNTSFWTRASNALNDPLMLASIAASALRRPLFLIIDDLQCCSAIVYDFLAELARIAPNTFVLAAYETSDVNALFPDRIEITQRESFKALMQNAMDLEAVEPAKMVRLLVKSEFLTPSLAERITRRASGNVYYALSCVEQLRQDLRLVQTQEGRFDLPYNDDEPTPIPNAISHYFRTRFDCIGRRLGLRFVLYKEVLLRLAVLGARINMAELEQFWKHESDKALAMCWQEAVEAWCDYGILRIEDNHGTQTVVFYEPWIPRTIETFAPIAKVKELHRLTASALESDYQYPTCDQLAELARHWKVADEEMAFAKTALRAAAANCSEGNLAAAQDLYRTLTKIWQHNHNANNNSQNGLSWILVFCDYVKNSLALGNEIAVRDALAALTQLAGSNEEKRTFVRIAEASYRFVCGKCDEAYKMIHPIFDKSYFLTRDALCEARLAQGRCSLALGNYKDAAKDLEDVCREYGVTGRIERSAHTYVFLSHALWCLGNAKRAHDLQRRAGDALKNFNQVRALAELEAVRACETCCENPSPESFALLNTMADRFTNYGDVLFETALFNVRLIMAILYKDEVQANALIERTRQLSLDHPWMAFPSIKAWTRILDAIAFLSEDLSFEARHAFDDALSLFTTAEDRVGISIVYFVRAFYALDTGDESQAAVLIEKAAFAMPKTLWCETLYSLMRAVQFGMQADYAHAQEAIDTVLQNANRLGAKVFESAAHLVEIDLCVNNYKIDQAKSVLKIYKKYEFPPLIAPFFEHILERVQKHGDLISTSFSMCLQTAMAADTDESDSDSVEVNLEPQRFMPSVEFKL